jgi:adenosylmethionine---8-amino-7-oxononanoate aminotransferase
MTDTSVAHLDRRHFWHPFTQMRDWERGDPIVLVSGRGAVLTDDRGRTYLDANSSIWTNLHGHRRTEIDRAIRRQLGRVAHTSALGLTNIPAPQLAARLVRAAKVGAPQRRLSKVFFSDDGSTAVEAALKMAYEHTRRTRPGVQPRFLSVDGAYHGDTVGAVSVGHIDLFHSAFGGLLFKSDKVAAPFCHRCPFNRAKPDRADARTTRKCGWECVGKVEEKFGRAAKAGRPYTAFVVEPRVQGAAGLIAQPEGWLGRVADIARAHGALLIADEVLTGFGRTGGGPRRPGALFATQAEGVAVDFLALAKGLTGGYLPMAATLTTDDIYAAFLGEYAEFKTFFHGHSYTGNQLGASAALASLDLLEAPGAAEQRARLERWMAEELPSLWTLRAVGDIRRIGLIAGVELSRDWTRREPYDLRLRVGGRVTDAMAKRGVLTRPIGNVLVFMPPYCTTRAQVRKMVCAMHDAIDEVTRSI